MGRRAAHARRCACPPAEPHGLGEQSVRVRGPCRKLVIGVSTGTAERVLRGLGALNGPCLHGSCVEHRTGRAHVGGGLGGHWGKQPVQSLWPDRS